MRRDHNLVRGEALKSIRDREQRVGVADDAARVHPRATQPLEPMAHARGRCCAGDVFVRRPVTETGIERRCDDEHLAAVSRTRANGLVQHVALDRLVRHDEDARAERPVRGHRTLLSKLGSAKRSDGTGSAECFARSLRTAAASATSEAST